MQDRRQQICIKLPPELIARLRSTAERMSKPLARTTATDIVESALVEKLDKLDGAGKRRRRNGD